MSKSQAVFRLTFITLLCLLIPDKRSQAQAGLVAWYPAEGNANDVVGGHNGTLVGGVTFAPGKFGQAFSLDGTSGYINAGSSSAFDLGDFTIAAWISVDPAANTGERRVVSRDDILVGSPRQAYTLKSSMPFACPVNGGAGLAIIAGGVLSTVCANAPLSTGFHHLAGTRSGSTIMLYVDGVLVSSASASNAVISPAAPLVIGQVSLVLNGEFFAGLIDEVQIYNRALSASEIQTAMNSGGAPPAPVTTPPQPVAPGTSTTFTNANVINQTVVIPPDANMGGAAFIAASFIAVAPAVFNSTRLPGTTQSPNWSGGNTPTPAQTTCTAIANTGGNCMVIEDLCFDANHNPILPCNITAPTTPIQLASQYKTQSSQPCPALIIADDGQNDWANITTGFNPADPTISGGTKGLNTDTAVVDLGAGNCAALSSDTTPPTTTAITSPLMPTGSNGWFTTSPVTVILAATDDTLVKQITYSATGAQPTAPTTVAGASTLFQIATQGVTIISYQATDQAGNVEALKTLTVKIDTTPPSISITSPTNGATYTINQPVAASYTCTDSESSPPPSCTGPVPNGSNIDTASVGSKVFTVNSTDAAGLSSSRSVSYSVSYNVCILYDPTHAVKSGAVIPLKMYLCDAKGNDVSNSGVIVHAFKLIQVSTGATDTIVDAGSANPDNDFRFDSTLGPRGGYIFNLMANLATGTYELFFTAGNDPSTTHFLQFQVN